MSARVDRLRVLGSNPENLHMALTLALADFHDGATHYRLAHVDTGQAHDHGDYMELHGYPATTKHPLIPLPCGLVPSLLEPLVRTWLYDDARDRGPEPDTDGSVSKAWIVEGPGVGDTPYGCICRVRATWQVHGK